MRYGRYMIINVHCNWPHKINALFAINAIVSIRTRDFLRSISLDLVPLRPNRRRAAFRKETRTLNHRTRFWSLRFTFRRSAVITTMRICRNHGQSALCSFINFPSESVPLWPKTSLTQPPWADIYKYLWSTMLSSLLFVIILYRSNQVKLKFMSS